MTFSVLLSLVLHVSLYVFATYAIPFFKINEPIEQAFEVDYVENLPTSSLTTVKVGSSSESNKVKDKNKKDINKEKKIKSPPPPPPPASPNIRENINKKNDKLKKQKDLNEIAEIIKKKPKLKIEKKKEIPKVVSKPKTLKKQTTPKVVVKPKKIKNKQKENFAKGILNTLAEAKIKNNEVKNEKANKEDLLNKIKKMAGNSNRQVKETSLNFSQTDIDRISNHVRKFFNVSYAASEVNNIITLKIITNLDGTVKSVSIIEKAKYMRNKFYRAAADAARRAVLDSSPLPLPKGKEKLFTNIIFDFNTSFIKSY